MICKCGATVKASANKTGITLWAFGIWPEGRFARGFGRNPAGEQQRPASSGQVASRSRNDRGRLEGRDHGILEGVTITLEQHPPLESTRAHNGKTGQELFPQVSDTGRHQCHLFQYVRKRTRVGDGLVQKDPAIKRLVLGTNETE